MLLYFLFSARYPRLTYVSGWGLMSLMVLLTAYNMRKKIPFIPAISSEVWLQVHVYTGLIAALIFGMHIHFHMPTGRFENLLAALFVLVTLSGFVGLWITRTFPKRLTARGGEVIFEQIPFERRRIHERARTLALDSVNKSKSATIADFYATRLDAFFARPQNIWSHILDSEVIFNRMLFPVQDLNRFLNEEERMVMAEITRLLEAKNRLDYHYSLQLTLKVWLFVHIPLTYGLMVCSGLHIALVYAFSSAAG